VAEQEVSMWEVIPDAEGREGTLWIQDEDGILIAEVYGDYRHPETLPKRASLIASSPDLLAACEAAMPHILWACTHGSRCDEAIKIVTDAIMKAKGAAS
jgi:hypothetical protein